MDLYSNEPDPIQPPANQPIHPLDRGAPPPRTEYIPPPPTQSQRRVHFPRHTPILTYTLLGINILVFLIDFLLGQQLTLLGAKINEAIIAGEYWRLVTPMFLHGGLLHIGFNSYALYIIGPQIERNFGSLRFGAIYVLSSMTGVLFSFTFSAAPSIGASGAIFGLIGAMIPMLYRNRNVLANTRSRIMNLVQLIVINLLIGLSPGIDNWGHLGGLIGGSILAWFAAPLFRMRADLDDTIHVEDKSSPAVAWSAIIGYSGLFLIAFLWLVGIKS